MVSKQQASVFMFATSIVVRWFRVPISRSGITLVIKLLFVICHM